jgi:hypothetical protein
LIVRRTLPLALALLASPGVGVLQAQTARFSVEAGQDGRAVVDTNRLLDDSGLQGALESGLPLRFRLRVELWRKALFDQLAAVQEINVALVYDPLAREYLLNDGDAEDRYASVSAALVAMQRKFRTEVRPTRSGRYYYLATLKVETLSLSDLDELRRWLRGEVQPAVEGRASPGRAVESGLGRLLVRVIGLPSRSYEDRSGTFIVH